MSMFDPSLYKIKINRCHVTILLFLIFGMMIPGTTVYNITRSSQKYVFKTVTCILSTLHNIYIQSCLVLENNFLFIKFLH